MFNLYRSFLGKRIIFLLIGISMFCSASSQQLIPYRMYDKWGFSDPEGKIIFPCIYDDVSRLSVSGYRGFYITSSAGKKGILTEERIYSLNNPDSFVFHTIQPVYDAISVTRKEFLLCKTNGKADVYSLTCRLLFTGINMADTAGLQTVYLSTPQIERRKAEEENLRRYRQDNRFAQFRERLILFKHKVYRYLPGSGLPSEVWLYPLTEKQLEISKKHSDKWREGDHFLLKGNDSSAWYKKINTEPPVNDPVSSWKNIAGSLKFTASTTYSWAPDKKKYTPSATAKLALISQYPHFFLLIDSGKAGLAYPDQLSQADQPGSLMHVSIIPVYDSLVGIQHIRYTGNAPLCFYFKKKDSIAVTDENDMEIIHPVKVKNNDDLKIIRGDIYLLRSSNGDSTNIRLYNGGSVFSPGIQDFAFDAIKVFSERNNSVIIHNAERLQLYNIISFEGEHRFVLNLDAPDCRLISFTDYYVFEKGPRSPEGGYLRAGKPRYRGFITVYNSKEKKYYWYTKQAYEGIWQQVYVAEKILEDCGFIKKIEKNGKAGYTNSEGKEYFTDK